MKRISFFLIMVFLVCVVSISSLANDPAPTEFKWQVGEELYYKVKYAFLTVGSLYIQVLGKDTVHNRPVYHCRLEMKSTPAIPFVHLVFILTRRKAITSSSPAMNSITMPGNLTSG
jgi:hypothetical protein